ncbi:MAG: PQQ-dependent dehydrogenase, methanol/ethanol family, partial [Pseudomonadota bacterium]|nr:PQQ-dependent dehydrogenase, methanol/ethanol family [Pseudomonadota bacterium]
RFNRPGTVERRNPAWRAFTRSLRARRRWALIALVCFVPFAAAAWRLHAAPPPAADAAATTNAATKNLSGATFNLAPNDPAGEWHSQARDYANSRYSPLHEIDTGNVGKLRLAWTFSDGTLHGHEAAPLVVGNTMYIVTPFPDMLYALDLTKPGPYIKWTFKPNPSPQAMGKACCDVVNRGMVYVNGKVIYNLLDDHTVAVDANTGKQVWRTWMDNLENGVTMTMAPFAVGNKVFVGNSGGELGVRGWLAALDVDTGKELWRAHSTGSDKDVLIGADFKPFYSWMKGKDLGIHTWPAGMWKHGGGSSWAWVSYDPDTKLIYYGTSNPSPRVPVQRPGYNLWASTIFARDADTGMARWAYQTTPHDQWDYDAVNENILMDLPINGRQRKVLVHFDRNSYAYTIDRTTGEVLVVAPFADQNWSTGFDMKTGQPIVNPDKEPKPGIKIDHLCPTDLGGKDWEPGAASPRTGLVYAGILNICMDLTDHLQGYIPGTPYDGMEMKRHPASGDNLGEFMAWNPATGKKVWSIKEKFMTMSGALATAGDVVFYGTADGWFRAVDARSGKVLWSQKLSSGVIGQPMTYLGPHGRQYIAIYSGVGGAATVRADTTVKGFPAGGGTLYVFSIGGDSLGTVAGIPASGDGTPPPPNSAPHRP